MTLILQGGSVFLILLGGYGIGRTLQVRSRSPHPELAIDLIAYFIVFIVAGLVGLVVA